MELTESEKKKIEEEETYRHEVKQKLGANTKNPALAAILSFVIPGLGQVYCEKVGRGILIFITAWLVIPWIYGIFDAYNLAKGEKPKEKKKDIDFFMGLLIIIIAFFFFAAVFTVIVNLMS